MDLPIGWEDRKTADFGDRKEREIRNSDKFKEVGPIDPTVPIGWSCRHATKTICDLTKSGDATDIAAAEVHLKAAGISNDMVMFAPPNIGLEGLKDKNIRHEMENTVAENVNNFNCEKNDSQTLQLLNMLAAAVLQMDTRLRTVEANINTLCNRTEKIETLQEKLIEIISKR